MADFLTSCTKYVLSIFNSAFLLAGLAVAAFGIVLLTKLIDVEILPGDFSTVSIVLIVTGFVLSLIPFLGCCGALTENRCMLMSFSTIMTLVLLFEIGIGIAAYEKRDWLKEQMEKSLNETLNDIKNDTSLLRPWNKLQYEFTCCGIYGPDDWKAIIGGDDLPSSCCQKAEGTACKKDDASKTGCKDALVNYVNDNMVTIIAVSFAILTLQLIGTIFGCCLFTVYGQRNQHEAVPRSSRILYD